MELERGRNSVQIGVGLGGVGKMPELKTLSVKHVHHCCCAETLSVKWKGRALRCHA